MVNNKAKHLFDDLNPIQKKAVEATEGPVLILAGAGSGKTRVLTYRVVYLIKEKNIPPENILMVTFTNKAAGEMQDRIIRLLNFQSPTSNLQLPTMGTFHSFCARVLRRDGKVLGLPPGFAIYDEGDTLDAVKEAMKNLNILTQKTSPGAVRSIISGAKNELISALEYPQYARGYFQETAAKIYPEYQKILEKNYALDFDDLLLHTIKLFQTDPAVLTRYQIRFRYILIDEYQDTNPAQYLISKYLANRHKNICVVGDASQSIYSFRGADFRNIVNFQKDYSNTRVFNLEQNYRSTQNILDAAHAVISKNKSHPILKLWTKNDCGEKIEVVEVQNEIEESLFILNVIASVVKQSKKKIATSPSASRNDINRVLSDFAILYRTNAQSRAIEEQFLKSGIPYKLFGGVSFYQRKEIKDVLSYLRLLQNPKDSVSLKRAEKIGKTRLAKVTELHSVILSPPKVDEGSLANPDSIGANASISETSSEILLRQLAPQAGLADQNDNIRFTTLELLDKILQVTGYLAYLDDGTDEGKSRVENVKELRSVAEEFSNLTEFLENVALVENGNIPSRKQNIIQSDSVTLMTLHSAKGLEFPTVFIVGMEEGLFPHSRAMLDTSQLEEERRLMYVGITRAKEKLYLTYSRQRLYFGVRSSNLVSRFLADIPEDLVLSNASFKDTDDWLDT